MTTHAWAVLHVPDVAASLAFYSDRLGWRQGERAADDVAFIHDQAGDALLLVGPRAGDVAAYVGPDVRVKRPGDTLRYPGGDIDAQLADLGGRGLVGVHIAETPWRDRELHVPTLDGYTLVYVAPAPLSPEETLALYESGPHELDAALAGLTDRDLDLSPTPDAWAIRQLAHHIVDGDDLWAMVIKAALAAPGCTYEQDWYDTTNASAATLDYARLAVDPALALFRAQRASTASLVRHLPDAWDRHVQFTRAGLPEAQRLTVGFVVRIQARHALEHIADIREIRYVHGH